MFNPYSRNTWYMEKCGNMTPPKVNNSTVTDPNDSESGEMLDEKFKTMIWMISEFNENMSRYLNEIRNKMQAIKVHLSDEIEILKK